MRMRIIMLKVQYWLASIPGRVFAFITVRQTTILTVIKAKTRPGIEARLSTMYWLEMHEAAS